MRFCFAGVYSRAGRRRHNASGFHRRVCLAAGVLSARRDDALGRPFLANAIQ